MRSLPTLTLVAALLLPAAAAAAAPSPDKSVTEVRTASYHGVIFGAGWKAHDGVGKLGGHPLTGFWTPTEADVAALEAKLATFLKTHKDPRARSIVATLATYKRQYSGVVNRAKGRFVYASLFCRVSEGWKKRPHGVDDGGKCYFQVAFDVARKTFVYLQINGSA